MVDQSLNSPSENLPFNKSQEDNHHRQNDELKVVASQSTLDPEDSNGSILGFKPRIVQHQTTHKQPFSLSMARKRTASRKVDLQWLDDCLVDGGSVTEKPAANIDDQDVIYSSDDEPHKPVKTIFKAPPPPQDSEPCPNKSDDTTPPPSVKKRKFIEEEENIPENEVKRHKIDSPSQNWSDTNHEPSDNQTRTNEYEFNDAAEAGNDRSTKSVLKENASTTAKRERLIKYVDFNWRISLLFSNFICPILAKWHPVQLIKILCVSI